MSRFFGVVIFERTDGVPFDTDPLVYLTKPADSYGEARHAATVKASEALRNGAMVQEGMGIDTRSMLAAADRISAYRSAAYSFELPNGTIGDFLVRWSVCDTEE